MNFKNNVCFNLTTQTSKYHFGVRQFSDQCFSHFLLSLLTKKSKHFFFENFLVILSEFHDFWSHSDLLGYMKFKKCKKCKKKFQQNIEIFSKCQKWKKICPCTRKVNNWFIIPFPENSKNNFQNVILEIKAWN